MADRSNRIAALMALPGATSSRLGRLLASRDPVGAWDRVIAGRIGDEIASSGVVERWRRAAAAVDFEHLGARLEAHGITPSCWGEPDHPEELSADPDPAPLVLRVGAALADGPRVGIVGTRRSSSVGREIAFELGAGLAAAGVAVVSGLALGIDGAAHRGVLSVEGAAPVAVVGSGPDVVYPRRHADLWQGVIETGTLLTEVPLGGAPEPWRFPARNRLIAALVDLLVVVESREAGGSLLTVEQATRRDVPVMAVPGSVRNPAAAGTNHLLADGCPPARDVADVLVALGLGEAAASARRRGEPCAKPTELEPSDVEVLAAVDDGPTTLDTLVARTGIAVPAVLGAIDRLTRSGLLAADGARYMRSGR